VLDLGRGVAAPYAATLLAEQGVEVLRVEPPSRDRGFGTAAYYVFNRSKRLTLLDLDSDADRQLIRTLAGKADAVIVDMPESHARRFDVTFEALSRDRDDLIYLAMPPYGSRGPLADIDADESMVAASSGLSGGQ
jgi:crotonobetainyl-CoA:carnitine CoA-transferase CaiB-like acyl-CoA transferase